jgi:serine/threonine protein kinase
MVALFQTSPAFRPGDVVEGRYQIQRKLAEGGMGSVFLAEHVLIRRRVALKLLHPELASDSAMVRRFMNEASAAGTLGHPHIVESTDMGFTRNGVPYIVFEYLEGTLLIEEVYRLGGLPIRRALQIASQIASALEAAHNARIVHLDLKSDNVFLVDRSASADHVKVLDFGISRFLETDLDAAQRGQLSGTPEFMAPEQVTMPDLVVRTRIPIAAWCCSRS